MSSQRTRFPWMRGCIWTGCFIYAFDDDGGRSPSYHDASHAHRYDEVWYRAASGTAKRASGAATRTTHGTRRAASGAAHRTRRATERAPRHHHHRDNKVIIRSRNRPASARAAGRPYSAPGATAGKPRQRTFGHAARARRAIARSPTKRAVSQVAQIVAQIATNPTRNHPLNRHNALTAKVYLATPRKAIQLLQQYRHLTDITCRADDVRSSG